MFFNFCATLLVLAIGLPAQERPLAIQNARVLTMAGLPLPCATVLVRNGTIEAVGADVEVPPGALVVDARGHTLMPGLVSAYSRAGLAQPRRQEPEVQPESRRFRRGDQRSAPSETAINEAAKKVATSVYARQPVFGELLRCGVTTLAVVPSGAGFPGQGAVLDPAGSTPAALTKDAEAFVLIKPIAGTASKKLVKEALTKAGALVEERKKPKPAEQPGAAPKPEEAPKPAAAEEGAAPGKDAPKAIATPPAAAKEQAAPKDPNLEVLADVLEGKRRALLELSSAFDVAHFLDAAGKLELPRRALVAPRWSTEDGRLDEAADRLTALRAPILVEPALSTPAFGRQRVNPAARLCALGFEVGFLLGDSKRELHELRWRLMELVRHGLPESQALAGVTLVPAKALGLEARVGSIEKGKDADLLLLDGDPLDPTARLVRLWHRGQPVDLEGSR